MDRHLQFRYEKVVKYIYAFDIWSYHLMVYLLYGNGWKSLPAFKWTSPFWGLAVVSMTLWTCMVLYWAFYRPSSWNQTPNDTELMLWFLACFIVHPIFFYSLAYLAKTWRWLIAIIVYRGWSTRQMLAFLQEVREKMIFLQIGGGVRY